MAELRFAGIREAAMPETAQWMLGTQVGCTDGICGLVHSLVVEPARMSLTHLIVEPPQRLGLGRLVPMELAEPVPDGVELSCDLNAFGDLPDAETSQLVPGNPAGYVFVGSPPIWRREVQEVVPGGEAAVQSGMTVLATDGPVGDVAGVVTRLDDYVITQIAVRQQRSLLGHKIVLLPATVVSAFEVELRLTIDSDEVERQAQRLPG